MCYTQISKRITHWAAIALFLFFGLRTLYDAIFVQNKVCRSTKYSCYSDYSLGNRMTPAWPVTMQEGESEWDEVERELGSTNPPVKNGEGSKQGRGVVQTLKRYLSPVFLEAFIITFLAEWGDRSQVC